MSDVLAKICADKLDHIAACRLQRPMVDVEEQAKNASPPRGFGRALSTKIESGGYGLIAEIKKSSPSKGLIREDFDPPALARSYRDGGAACISVLTDTPYFQGADAFLVEARAAVDLPVLRKDFMLDAYQVVEARALGADCILLIMAALEDAQAQELEAQAMELGMDVLIEVHNAPELERAIKLKSTLLGVNNRNLKTLEVDIATTEELAAYIPENRHLVCESGLYTPDDLARMAKVGANRFLIGESLMRQDDVETATRNLLRINNG
ncbi:MAG: indole-3-glycerol phosphate synthase TrpC [Rhodospirillales bacterium]|nr:indole-3-glycerol phosphate synthase TrpC [Rhodospirillales bacterium]